MLAIKECLIREGVLNLTSTSSANHGNGNGNGTTLAVAGGENQPGVGGGDYAAIAAADAGVAAKTGSLYHNNKYNDFNVVSNNLRAISANYTVNNDSNRYRSYYDRLAAATTTAKPPLALGSQLAKFGEQKSVDTTHSPQNDNKSSNCSLSSASITAKSSCQQASSIYDKTKQQLHQQQQLQRQQQQSKQKEQQQTGTKASSSSNSTRYHGVHPHFHHHTAPAYYTDVNLHIHTPKANDVAALNENYQSVYNTPSQLVNEHYFPKTSTATVVPPPIGTGAAVIGRASTTSPSSVDKRDRERIIAPINEPAIGGGSSSSSNNRSSAAARAAFFRGGSAGSSGYNNNSGERKSCEPLAKSSPAFGRPTETGNSPTASATTTAAGRSRNSHRFAGKRRAVRVRSESRPISALYDIICKEKGLDIGTSSNNEDDSSAPSNEDDAHHSSTRSTSKSHKNKSSKEQSHQHRSSSSRNNSLKTSKDYAEISNCLTAFVATSISNYLGGPQDDSAKMDHSNTASGDTAASHDRTKRSHKTRTPSGHKKRKDVAGKTKSTVPRSPSDEEHNGGYTSEDSNEQRAHAALATNVKHRADCSSRMNGAEKKASSLPPLLHDVAYVISSSAVQQQLLQQQHKASAQSVTKKCSIHCRCHTGCECRKTSSNSYRTSSSHYPYEYHQSSLPPPNLSSDSCSCVRSPSTADDESLGYSPDKLYIEPVNMHLSGIPSSTASAVKNANSSSSGVVLEQTSNLNSTRNSKERVSRAHQRRQREEMRRHTDLPDLNSLSPSAPGDVLPQQSAKALSDDEGVSSSVNQQKSGSSKARRFINRPSRTPSRGRTTTGNSAHSSPHSTRRSGNQHPGTTTSSPSPSPPAANRHTLAAVGADSSSLNLSAASNTINTSAGVVTIEDVGSASSGDHIAHIQLSPLQIMTNSATPTASAELRPSANGSASARDAGEEVHLAETAANEEAGSANFGVQVAIADKKKCCEDDASQTSRSPCCGSPIINSLCQQIASPKQQSPRLSVSSSSENPHAVVSASSESDTKIPAGTVSPTKTKSRLLSSSSNDSTTANKKLVPSVSVSVKQNLSEMQFNGSPKKTSASKMKKPRSSATPPSPSTECTANFTRSAGRLSTAEESDTHLVLKHAKPLPRPRTSTMKSSKAKSANDLKPGSSDSSPSKTDLSPVNGATPLSPLEDRDKSSKRKSNLNRSLNDEATVDSDDSLAARRRRRRELGMVRQLVPSDDPALREMLSPRQIKTEISPKIATTGKPTHNELAYHMEIARRGWDLVNPSVSHRARSETASPKHEIHARESAFREKPSANRLARRSDTLHLGELRKLRSNDVNRKVNERTKSDLAEIKKIAEQANVERAVMASGIAAELAAQAVRGGDEFFNNDGEDQGECVVELATPARYGIGNRGLAATPPPAPSYSELDIAAKARERELSPAKHATFVQEECIYYEPEAGDELARPISNATMAGGILRQRILKARSMERDAGHEPPKLSPILRRRSTDDPTYIAVPSAAGVHSTSPLTATPNHIVSILKKKDHIAGESSSASSNASPVTFSANVVDTSNKKQKRAGILKKRSSLDESRYYSRSHSPDERSILIKSARRNSLEETAGLQQQQQHGILKQSSYESSKSDGCPSATEPHPHGILKKKDSTSTPSDGGTHAPKHVSISQAVKMAAAELGRETADNQAAGGEYEECGYTPNNEEYEIRPILKLESITSDDVMRAPKPILKKKSSGDSDEYEIRPILKTSRKSSREEFDLGGSISEDGRHYSEPPTVRPILKTDSPSKRRSLGGEELEQDVFSGENLSGHSPGLLKRRTRSLERQEAPVVDLAAALNAIATSQAAPVEFVSAPITTGGSISVAERIKNMEMFLNTNGSPTTPTDVNTSWESPLQGGATPRLLKPSAIRRDMYRDRYKTQPITNDEKMLFKATASPLDTSTTSAFKPTKSLDAGLNYNTFAHLNAPTAASSVSPGSSYTLTRCATQPLHSQQHHCDGTPPLRPAFGRFNPLSDSYSNSNSNSNSNNYINNNNNTSEQLNLSVGSESERIFEMSGIADHSVATESTSKVDAKAVADADPSAGGCGLTRKNSVRARANMFQQLQEKAKSVEAATAGSSATTATVPSREERNSPRRAPSQLSPTSAMLAASAPLMTSSLIGSSSLNTNSHEEPKTPQNSERTDEEVEPTSLPVSERLRFFNNLTEAANRSASSSYTRSPSQRILAASDRCGSANSYNHNNSFTFTPRSSYNGGSTSTSSASVTPTPMECCSPPLIEQQHQLISINEIDSPSQFDMHHEPNASPPAETQESSAFIQLTKSSSQTLLPSVLAQRLAMSAPAPATTAPTITTTPSSLTPVARRIKMKTIGKLLLPQTFLNNERNSQQNISANASNNFSGIVHNDTCESESGSCNETDSKSTAAPLKKIGKIKSPFIENCLQMQQKHHQLNSKCMKLDHKSTPHNALSALENNGPSGGVSAGSGGGGERDVNSLPPRKPLQNGNAGLPPPTRVESNEEQNTVSGKENNYCVTSSTPHVMVSPTASTNAFSEQQTHSPVVEMRKKFTRIMNNSTLSTLSQRHAVHSLTNGVGSAYSNAQVHGSSASSAPPTPRNSIIDDKFAKYFGLTPSCSQNAHTDATIATAPNHKIFNTNDHRARISQLENASSSSESNRTKRSATNYPPLPPPDFCHTPLNTSTASDSTDDLAAMGTLLQQEVHALPFEAINYNVCSNSNTPYYTPPSTCPYDITTPTTATAVGSALPTLTNATTHASSSSAANALQRRRDMAKRQRANTTNVTFTPTSSNTNIAGAQSSGMLVTPGTGRARALRSRAFTLTHGVPMPEVKRFEEIVVTKEEFQLASKEFERIFLGVI